MIVSRICAAFIGLVLTSSGIAKAVAIDAFVYQINSYDIVSNRVLLNVGAWSLCIIECILGVALMIYYRPQLAIVLASSLLLGFLAFSTWIWMTVGNQNCGCFGTIIERTSLETIFENSIMLGVLYVSWRSSSTSKKKLLYLFKSI